MAEKPTSTDNVSDQQPTGHDPSSVDGIISDALIDRNLDGDGEVVGSSGTSPFADTIGTLAPEDWKPPFFLRYRMPVIVGILATVAWAYLVIDAVDLHLGWNNIGILLPHELGGLAAGAITPLALLWMVVAFFERGRSLRHETEALRWQLSQLAYPSDRAEIRLKDVTQSLRRQAQELFRASDFAAKQAANVVGQVKRQSIELSQVSEDADI